MLEVEKTHHIEIQGHIPGRVLKYLKRELGDRVKILDNDEETVEASKSKWYKNIKKTMTPGDSVRIYRNNMGWNQDQLGKELGKFSKQYVSDIENGRREISKDVAKKLSSLFKVPVSRFI